MPPLKQILVPVAILCAAAVTTAVLVQSRPAAMQSSPPVPALLVTVIEAVREPVTFIVRSQGSVTARTRTTLVSEVSGQIIGVSDSFAPGGAFAAGEVLVRIDPRNYDANFKRAEANVARAQTQVTTENALAGYAFDDWVRLRQSDGNAKPPSELALRKPQLAHAIAELDSAEADLVKARGDLDRTVIRAPYQGMVREKLADLGQFVNPSSPIAVTFAIDRAEVRLPITEKDLAFIDLPDATTNSAPVAVHLTSAIGGKVRSWHAVLARSEGVFDAGSRVLHAVAEVNDPYGRGTSDTEPLRIGTYVNAEIQGRPAGDLFVLPRHALYRDDTVWIVDESSQIQPRQVTVTRRDDKSVYIASGLDTGDRVCISPISQPLPGMPVRFNDAP